MKSLKLWFCVFALAITPALEASDRGESMMGNWEGTARVIVQWCEQRDLLLSLEISADGKVSGKVGDAAITRGELKKKRNWFGGSAEDATTHIIKARLSGAIVSAEEITRDEIFIHLKYENSGLSGSLATSGSKVGGKETMVLTATSLRLVQTP